jgi:hypothetical protein
MPYHDELVEALREPVADAWRMWQQAQRAQATLQEHQARTREAAGEANRKLIALRRSFKALLGGRHRDYRRILMPRGGGGVEPDELALPDALAGEPAGNDAALEPASETRAA